MPAVLDVPAYSVKTDRRAITISGFERGELLAGQVYTLSLTVSGTGPFGSATLQFSDPDGTHPMMAPVAIPLGGPAVDYRWVFTAPESARASTVLELLLPVDKLGAVPAQLRLERWALMVGNHTYALFDGDGEDGFDPDNVFFAWGWDGTPNDSASSMFRLNMETGRQVLRENWRALRRLLWTPGRQVKLTRRWTDEDGVFRTATALAQFAGGLEPDVSAGGTRAEFSVDLKLTDPFFYETAPQVLTIQSDGVPVPVNVPGDFRSRRVVIEFTGTMTSLTLTAPGLTLGVDNTGNGAEAGTKAYSLDVAKFKATKHVTDPGVDATYVWTGKVTHAGLREWFGLEPGDGVLVAASAAGGGPFPVKITYYPAWL